MKQAFFLLTFAIPILAADPKYDVRLHYQKSEHEIPMRDGVRLHTTVYAPRKTSEKLPFLLVRTPYGTGPYGPEGYRANLVLHRTLSSSRKKDSCSCSRMCGASSNPRDRSPLCGRTIRTNASRLR